MQYPFYKSKPGQGLRSSPTIPKATSWCPVLWWPCSLQGRGSRSARAGHPCKGTDRVPWHLHCSQESQALASTNAVPRLREILSWARGSSAVMVPTRRAGNPSYLLNSKTVNTLRTGRLDFFPLQGEDHALFFKLINSSSS